MSKEDFERLRKQVADLQRRASIARRQSVEAIERAQALLDGALDIIGEQSLGPAPEPQRNDPQPVRSGHSGSTAGPQ